ncbi:MAG: hypothetical protein LBF02_02005, partial [Mycoplasmataceae bacterium]|nr:hypothetical protein [Mycoplasmataceae bacterium]
NVGLDFYTTQFIYSKPTPPPPPPEPTIIEEILKSIKLINVELGKINTKIDNIESVQKVQGEKLDKIDERLVKLENKVDNVIILNNLKIE